MYNIDTLPLTVTLKDGGKLTAHQVKYSINPESVKVVTSDQASLGDLKELNLGEIDLGSVRTGVPIELSIRDKLPEGVSLENGQPDKAKVTITVDGIATRKVQVSKFARTIPRRTPRRTVSDPHRLGRDRAARQRERAAGGRDRQPVDRPDVRLGIARYRQTQGQGHRGGHRSAERRNARGRGHRGGNSDHRGRLGRSGQRFLRLDRRKRGGRRMSLLVTGIRLPFDEPETAALDRARRLTGLQTTYEAAVCRVSIDARRGQISRVYSVRLDAPFDEKAFAEKLQMPFVRYKPNTKIVIPHGEKRLEHRPVVVGLGPAGLFAAYVLAKHGYRPLVLERGGDLDERDKVVDTFWRAVRSIPTAISSSAKAAPVPTRTAS